MTDDVGEFLAHYGVKGMKWGVRRERPDGISSRTSREARKDASEFARAKMFYGEGAGNRRKLIKNTVQAKSKDEAYKKAFDFHLERQNMAAHASKARSERRRKNVVSGTAKAARAVKSQIMGPFAPTLGALAISGIVGAAQTPQGRAFVSNLASTLRTSTAGFSTSAKLGREFLKNL